MAISIVEFQAGDFKSITNHNVKWEELIQSVSDLIFSKHCGCTPRGVSGVIRPEFCEKFKNTHCQIDHPAIIE